MYNKRVVRLQGERLSHAVGCAFAACLERKQRRDKDFGVTMKFDPKDSTFTRSGSFRQPSLTERLADPQELKPAGECCVVSCCVFLLSPTSSLPLSLSLSHFLSLSHSSSLSVPPLCVLWAPRRRRFCETQQRTPPSFAEAAGRPGCPLRGPGPEEWRMEWRSPKKNDY